MGRVLVLSNDPLLRSQRITLTPTDGFVLSRIDGTLSARDVISLSPVPPEDTERSLFGLVCTGSLDYKKKEPTSRTRPHPVRPDLREEGTSRTSPALSPESRPSVTPPPPAAPDPAPPPAAPEPAPEPKAPAVEPTAASAPAAPATPAPSLDSPPTTDPQPRKASAPAPPAKEASEPSPPATEGADSDPAQAIREAEGLFAAQRYEDAIRKVEPLVSQVDGPLKTRASILLARGCMKSQNRTEQAETVLLGLVDENPKCTPAYLFLGALYRSGNQIPRARSMYRKVLELEPRHRGAAAELSALGADGAVVHDNDLVVPPE
jgi:hypothetical protein